MGLTPLTFTGISQFSSDLTAILDRTMAIAKIPVQQAQNEQANILVKKQLLTDLGSAVAALGSSVAALGALGASKAVAASSSNANRVAVSTTGSPVAGTYTITDITSLAKAAGETTLSGYATADTTAVSSDGTVELVLGSVTRTITLGAGQNNLHGLRDAINALGVGVNASVINTGNGATPYYLALTATATGATTLQLRETEGDAGTNFLTANNQGANASFKLNGLSVTKQDNVISDVVSGVTFTLMSTTSAGETVTITASSSRGQLANALSAMVSSFNAVVEKVKAQVGASAGLLSGDFIVREVQAGLRALTAHSRSSGGIKSLADIGIEMDSSGKMSFNQSRFYSLSNSDLTGVFDLLGSTTTGLGALASRFTQVTDPVSGLIKTQQASYDAAEQRLAKRVAELNTRLDFLRTSLSRQLQQADTVLAQLESQQRVLEASIKSANLALFGKNKDD